MIFLNKYVNIKSVLIASIKQYMSGIASNTPDKHKSTEKINSISCFDDAKNRINTGAKWFYEANKNNPVKIQDLKTFLGKQEWERKEVENKYSQKRVEITEKSKVEEFKLYLYQKWWISEKLEANTWDNKFRKGFIDRILWVAELWEDFFNSDKKELVENILNADIKEFIKNWYNKLVSIKKDDVIAKMEKLWNNTDWIYVIWWMMSIIWPIWKAKNVIEGIEDIWKWVNTAEKVSKVENLYENPKYKFLWEYKDFLGNIDRNRILWEWDNAIVLEHPTKPDKVVKIAKEWKVDDLFEEYKNHKKFYTKLKKWYINWKIPENIQIWKIEEFINDKKWIYVMDKIEWQSSYTWHYKERYEDKLIEYSKNTWVDIDKLTDSQFIDLLDELKLTRVYWFDPSWDIFEKHNQKLLWTFHRWIVWRDDIQKWLNYLKGNWLEHTDLHSKNIMIKFEWNKPIFYIIDFGKVNIK